MPRWPGPLLAIGGALLVIGSVAVAGLAAQGAVDVGDPSVLAWLTFAGIVTTLVGLGYIAVRQLRVRRHLPPERYRGPSVLVLVLLVLGFAFLVALPFGADAIVLTGGEGELSPIGAAVLLLSTQVALLLVSWLLVFRPGALAGLPSLPGRNAAAAVTAGLGWGLGAWVGATVVAGAVIAGLQAIGIEPEPQVAGKAIATVDPWLVVLSVVIMAPVAEEVFFRGVVFNALRREVGRRWAFLGSAALFGVIHLELVGVVPLFLLGLALAWIYERTDNLLAPVAMHATVNAISVALALLARFEVIQLPV
jgi:membrane protease YdiL (CAAX protease family)